MVGGGDNFDVILSHGRTLFIRRISGVQRVQDPRIRITERQVVDFVSQVEFLSTWDDG